MGYYRGDPGFFSVFKSLAGSAASMIPVVGGAIGGAIERIGTKGGAVQAVRSTATTIAKRGTAIIAKHPVLSAAGAAGVVGAAGTGAALLHRKAGGVMVAGHRRRKRMNVTNVRALRRAIRRSHGFARLAMKTIHLVHPKKHARFGGFKKRRKR